MGLILDARGPLFYLIRSEKGSVFSWWTSSPCTFFLWAGAVTGGGSCAGARSHWPDLCEVSGGYSSGDDITIIESSTEATAGEDHDYALWYLMNL